MISSNWKKLTGGGATRSSKISSNSLLKKAKWIALILLLPALVLAPLVGDTQSFNNSISLGAAYAETDAEFDVGSEEEETPDIIDNSPGIVGGVKQNPENLQQGIQPIGIDISPATQTLNNNSLKLEVGDAGSFEDVDNIGNAITWPLSATRRQIRISADFGSAGVEKTRTVTVEIPRGYMITEYSASAATPVISGVSKINLSTVDDPKVASSLLTAQDGTAWASQVMTGYTGPNSSAERNQRVYDGKITYTFNSACDKIELTITLGLDQYIMPHDKTTATLNPIKVTMVSGTDTLNETLNTTVSGLVVTNCIVANAIYGGTRTIEGETDPDDSNKGTVPEFRTSYNTSMSDTITGTQPHLADKIVFVLTYPEGVELTGFHESITNTSRVDVDASTFTSGTFGGGHLTVTLDTTKRTVTFSYDKVTASHRIGSSTVFTCYWITEVDNDVVKWGDTLRFTATYDESSGLQTAGSTQAHPQQTIAGPNITIAKPAYTINLSAYNITRRDLNAYADGAYPYDYMLGGFRVQNVGPSVATNLLYEFSFSPNLHIRAVALPGLSGNNYSKLEALTNTGRTIELGPYTVTNTSSTAVGLTVTSMMFGLAEEEYLISLKAWQDSLSTAIYTQSYVRSHTSYFGRFQNGQEGDVTLTITDVSDKNNPRFLASVTDHTKIGWTNFGAGTAALTSARVNTEDGTTTGTYYPGGAIDFTALYTMGSSVRTNNDGVDPIVYICLPEGIDLDTASVKATSLMGNFKGAPFDLKPLGVDTFKVNEGLQNEETWKAYAFTSYNTLDMVALANHNFGAVMQPEGYSQIYIDFRANVSTACKAYPGLAAQNIVIWDFGKTASSATAGVNYTFLDANNITGKGTAYSVVGATQARPINIVPQPGLKVNIGIRTYEGVSNPNPYYTYNGTRASIAPVTVNAPAEIWLEYENSDADDYKAGSEIYLPIPKKGKVYDDYFNDIIINPATGAHDNKAPAWTGSLTGSVTLPGFTTYYLLEDIYETTPVPIIGGKPDDWVPITGDWKTEAEVGTDWAQVTMLKFVASGDIVKGASGYTEFTIDVATDAKLGDVNYWRSYQKGWRDLLGDGSWVYGSVVAAEPSMSGIEGMVFLDINTNGEKDSGEDFDPTAAGKTIAAVLTEKDGGITPLNLVMDDDGSFKSLNANGTQYFLKIGEYTITFFNNTNGAYYFTPESIPPATGGQSASDGTDWYMDVQQGNIAANQSSATFGFIVDPDMSTNMTIYVGVGVRNSWTVTYLNGFGSQFLTPATETVPDGLRPSNNPVISGTNVMTGYDPATVRWTLDKEVVLSNGTPIAAGVPITTAQLRQVIVREDISAKANLTKYTYTVTYHNTGADLATNTPPVDTAGDAVAGSNIYDINSPVEVLGPGSGLAKANWTFVGWATSLTKAADGDVAYEPGDKFNITANTDLYPVWEENLKYTVTYHNNGADAATSTAPVDSNSPYYVDTKVTVLGPTNGGGNLAQVGWTLAGWATTPGGIVAYVPGNATTGNFTITSDVDLYPVWTERALYTVTYSGNGNTGGTVPADSNSPYYAGATVTVVGQGAMTRANFTFLGWSTNQFATAAQYTPGSTFIINANTTLYAVWSENAIYTVTYNGNGNTGGSAPVDTSGNARQASNSYYVFSTVGVLGQGDLGKSGYSFQGWATSPAGAAVYAAGQAFTITGNVTLYAAWSYISTPPPGNPDPDPPVVPPVVVTVVEEDPPETEEPPTPPVVATTPSDPPENQTSDDPSTFFEIDEQEEPLGTIDEIKNAGIPVSTIGGLEVPLYGLPGMNVWALVNLILCIIAVIIAVVAIIRMLRQRKQEREDEKEAYKEEGKKDEKHRRPGWLIVLVIMAILGVVVFILTEDMTQMMVFIDYWTIVNAILFVVAVISARLAFKRKKEEKDEYEDTTQDLVS